nr:hypothetical protein [Phyllobacterium sp. A18/5-2]
MSANPRVLSRKSDGEATSTDKDLPRKKYSGCRNCFSPVQRQVMIAMTSTAEKELLKQTKRELCFGDHCYPLYIPVHSTEEPKVINPTATIAKAIPINCIGGRRSPKNPKATILTAASWMIADKLKARAIPKSRTSLNIIRLPTE